MVMAYFAKIPLFVPFSVMNEDQNTHATYIFIIKSPQHYAQLHNQFRDAIVEWSIN